MAANRLNRPLRNNSMQTFAQSILVASNLALAGAVWFMAFRHDSSIEVKIPTADPSTPQPVPVASAESITIAHDDRELRRTLAALTVTMQGFNTSLIQYDFLQREIQRLRVVDEMLGNRLREIHTSHRTNPTEQTEKALDLISNNQKQIRSEIDTRREQLTKLLSQVEEKNSRSQRTLQPQSPPVAPKAVPTAQQQNQNNQEKNPSLPQHLSPKDRTDQ